MELELLYVCTFLVYFLIFDVCIFCKNILLFSSEKSVTSQKPLTSHVSVFFGGFYWRHNNCLYDVKILLHPVTSYVTCPTWPLGDNAPLCSNAVRWFPFHILDRLLRSWPITFFAPSFSSQWHKVKDTALCRSVTQFQSFVQIVCSFVLCVSRWD